MAVNTDATPVKATPMVHRRSAGCFKEPILPS
jgi:hypothetical protein